MRPLHPVAWWVWALCLSVVASRTTNPALLLIVTAVVAWVVLERHDPGRSRILLVFLGIGMAAVLFRLIVTTLLGGGVTGNTIVFRLPEVPLPDWTGAVRIGGEVSLEALLTSLYEALQLLTMLACLGAANALASPRRLLRYLPATLYDIGTALVVGLSYAPALVEDVADVRRARMLRGHPGRGLREMARMIIPVTAGALDRAVSLGASMESRGYGRAGSAGPTRQRRAFGVTLVGVVGVIAGMYALLDGATPTVIGLPILLCGLALSAGALWWGTAGDRRSHYRRDPWAAAEWLVVGLGAAAATVALLAGTGDWDGMAATRDPTVWPGLPFAPVATVLAAGLAGVVTPEPPRDDDADPEEIDDPSHIALVPTRGRMA